MNAFAKKVLVDLIGTIVAALLYWLISKWVWKLRDKVVTKWKNRKNRKVYVVPDVQP